MLARARMVPILILSTFLTACALKARMGDFTVISTKNIPTPAHSVKGKDVEGKSCVTMVFAIPLGEMPNVENALDEALRKADGDIMVDAVVTTEYTNYILWGKSCIYARGTVGASKR